MPRRSHQEEKEPDASVMMSPQVADVFIEHVGTPVIAQDDDDSGLVDAPDQLFAHLLHDARKAGCPLFPLGNRDKNGAAVSPGVTRNHADPLGANRRIW